MINLSNVPQTATIQTPTTNNVYMSNEMYNQTIDMAYKYGFTVGTVEGAAAMTKTFVKNNKRANRLAMGIILTPLIIYGIKVAYSTYREHKMNKLIKIMEEKNGQEASES